MSEPVSKLIRINIKARKYYIKLHFTDLDKPNLVWLFGVRPEHNFTTTQLPQKMVLTSKVVIIDSKIIISLL